MAKIRVSALARDLGIDSKELILVLRGIGEYVKTASSTLEAPVVQKVYEHFGTPTHSNRSTVHPPDPLLAQNNPWRKPAERVRDAVDYYNDGRRWYNDPRPPRPATNQSAPFQRRPVTGEAPTPTDSRPPRPAADPSVRSQRRPVPKGTRAPASQRPTSEAPSSGRRAFDDRDWAAEVFQVRRSDLRMAPPPRQKYGEPRRERLSPDDLRWVEIFFDLSAKQVWTDAGLRPCDADLAKECFDAGLLAHDLSRIIGSNAICWWITEGGQSPAWAVRQMRLRPGHGESDTA